MTGGIGGLPPVPPFDCALPPVPPVGGPQIQSVDSPQDYRFAIHGTGFLSGVDGIRLTGTPFGDITYYDPGGPNAALNPSGSVVAIADDLITIDDTNLGGSVVNQVDLLNTVGTPLVQDTGENVPIGGAPVTYPLLEGIQSQAPNSVTFTGQRFQTGTAGQISHLYVRLASYAIGCFEGPQMSVFLDGTPNNYGWVVDQFDDNTIRLTNPSFSSCVPDDADPNGFLVNGVSFDAPNYGSPLGDGYYFYEPWGVPSPYSAYIQGAAAGPTITSADAPFANQVNVIGTGFDAADGIRFVGPGSFDLAFYDPSGPHAGFNQPGSTVNFTDTFIGVGWPDWNGAEVNEIHLMDPSFSDILVTTDFDFTVPSAPAEITSVESTSDDSVTVHGTNLTQLGMLDVKRFSNGAFKVYEPTIYPGLADPDILVFNWTDTIIEFTTAGKQQGQVLVSIDKYDRTMPNPAPTGAPYDFPAPVTIMGGGVPTITDMSSPATNTIRIEGTNLRQFAAFDIYYNVPGSDFAVYNTDFYGPGYDTGKTILTFTNTVFEFVMDVPASGEIIDKADVYQNVTYDPFATLVQTYNGPDFPIQ